MHPAATPDARACAAELALLRRPPGVFVTRLPPYAARKALRLLKLLRTLDAEGVAQMRADGSWLREPGAGRLLAERAAALPDATVRPTPSDP